MAIKEKNNYKIIKLISIYLIIFLTIFIFIEHFNKRYLAKKYGYHIPISFFLFKKNSLNQYYNERGSGWKDTAILNTIDPLLGYAHDDSIKKTFENFINGYFIYEKKFQNSNTLNIAIFGGSSSDSTTSIFNNYNDHDLPYSWPQELSNILSKKQISHRIYNGAVIGYSSSTSLLKFIRDYNYLNPDIVISFNGLNDVENRHNLADHKMYNFYQYVLFKNLIANSNSFFLMPNTIKLINLKLNVRKINLSLGPKNRLKDFENWSYNTSVIYNIIKNNNKKYYLILQPIMGFGKYEKSKLEKKLYKKIISRSENYEKQLLLFFKNAKNICNNREYCLDYTDIFNKESKVYSDTTHYNYKGTKVLANKVFQDIILLNK